MTVVDLIGLDATALGGMVRSRVITARQLVDATLSQIDKVEPTVNAFRVVTASAALVHADRIDALSDADLAMLPLAGVPIAIKDDTDVAGESTMWGTAIDRGICERDADVVSRLRKAGATIIGKTNVPELTLWPWTASKRWGVTRNPWNTDLTPGGSSGGSAVAVCTGMAAMALGSDGGGSIRYPAGLTGLIGLKPQRGRVPVGSEHGSAWHGMLALGPIARSVRDAALFLDLVSTEGAPCFRDAMNDRSARMRIAVSTNAPPGTQAKLSPAMRRVIVRATALLTDLGHDVVEIDIDYGLASLWTSTVRYLDGVRDDVKTFPEPQLLEARTAMVARLARLLPRRTLRRSLEREQVVSESINRVFEDADVVFTPLCGSPAPSIAKCPTRGAIRSLRASSTSAWLIPWNACGQPALAVPIGIGEDNLPISIQLAGQTGDETRLLCLAAQIESAFPFHRWSAALPPHPHA